MTLFQLCGFGQVPSPLGTQSSLFCVKRGFTLYFTSERTGSDNAAKAPAAVQNGGTANASPSLCASSLAERAEEPTGSADAACTGQCPHSHSGTIVPAREAGRERDSWERGGAGQRHRRAVSRRMPQKGLLLTQGLVACRHPENPHSGQGCAINSKVFLVERNIPHDGVHHPVCLFVL